MIAKSFAKWAWNIYPSVVGRELFVWNSSHEIAGAAMIEVKQAVRIAVDYLTDLIPNIRDIQLEEVEFVEVLPPQWSVTLSYLRRVDPEGLSAIAELTGQKYERVYKEITVDSASGACVSIKIRELQ